MSAIVGIDHWYDHIKHLKLLRFGEVTGDLQGGEDITFTLKAAEFRVDSWLKLTFEGTALSHVVVALSCTLTDDPVVPQDWNTTNHVIVELQLDHGGTEDHADADVPYNINIAYPDMGEIVLSGVLRVHVSVRDLTRDDEGHTITFAYTIGDGKEMMGKTITITIPDAARIVA